jgi:hypothetical protein
MKFYRYEDDYHINGCQIELREFILLRETPCGYWIVPYYIEHYPDMIEKWKKWIPKSSKKRFAYPTKEEALVSLRARKERQIFYGKTSIARAKLALYRIEEIAKK